MREQIKGYSQLMCFEMRIKNNLYGAILNPIVSISFSLKKKKKRKPINQAFFGEEKFIRLDES